MGDPGERGEPGEKGKPVNIPLLYIIVLNYKCITILLVYACLFFTLSRVYLGLREELETWE